MKPASPKTLSGPLLLLACCLAISAVLWTLSSRQADEGRIEMERVKYTLNATRARLLKSGSERIVIDDNFDAWKDLVKRGITRQDQRLAWLETITNANRSSKLYGLDYTLDTPVSAPPGIARGLPLVQTPIRIKMPILVEQDLSRFLTEVHDSRIGLMRVKSCTLSRTGPQTPTMADRPGIEAQCELLWYTLKTGS
jgi:hypothetical protein